MSELVRVRRRRIVIAAPSFADALPAIRLGTDIAAHLGAEILAMLVEEEAVRRMTALPFSQALSRNGRAARPVTPEAMRGAFDRDASVTRKTLARAAGRASIRWSFETRQGQVLALLQERASAGDLLLVGYERALRQGGEVVLFDDLDPVDPGLLDLGLHLAGTSGRPPRLFVLPASVPEVRRSVAAWTPVRPARARPEVLLERADDDARFRDVIGRGRPMVLLIAASAAARLDIEAIVDLARCPVVIAVDG